MDQSDDNVSMHDFVVSRECNWLLINYLNIFSIVTLRAVNQSIKSLIDLSPIGRELMELGKQYIDHTKRYGLSPKDIYYASILRICCRKGLLKCLQNLHYYGESLCVKNYEFNPENGQNTHIGETLVKHEQWNCLEWVIDIGVKPTNYLLEKYLEDTKVDDPKILEWIYTSRPIIAINDALHFIMTKGLIRSLQWGIEKDIFRIADILVVFEDSYLSPKILDWMLSNKYIAKDDDFFEDVLFKYINEEENFKSVTDCLKKHDVISDEDLIEFRAHVHDSILETIEVYPDYYGKKRYFKIIINEIIKYHKMFGDVTYLLALIAKQGELNILRYFRSEGYSIFNREIFIQGATHEKIFNWYLTRGYRTVIEPDDPICDYEWVMKSGLVRSQD